MEHEVSRETFLPIGIEKKRCKLVAFFFLLLMLLGLHLSSKQAIAATFPSPHFLLHPQHTEQVEERAEYTVPLATLPGDPQIALSLLGNIPRVVNALTLTMPNYQEDAAVREAILSEKGRWRFDAQTALWYYTSSNALTVYAGHPGMSPLLSAEQSQIPVSRESTLLTARILLGLWLSRCDDPQLSLNGSVVIRADEILAWRGVQKHQRIAYPGAKKRFLDGYQWKHKQQVSQDLASLAQYYLCGQHRVRSQGKVWQLAVDAPYLSIVPLEENEKIAGYLVSPGNWIHTYEEHNNVFNATVDRRIFQLNPRNDYLALRLAFYLVEHWRQQAHNGACQEPLLMSRLLAASMITPDRANLTSRFIPRVEAALEKLYASHILGEPPTRLSAVDTSKAHWGHDWLASYWRLVPPPEIVTSYTARLK